VSKEADAGWAVIFAFVSAYDVWAYRNRKEMLSEAFRRYPPRYTMPVTVLLILHLLLPPRTNKPPIPVRIYREYRKSQRGSHQRSGEAD